MFETVPKNWRENCYFLALCYINNFQQKCDVILARKLFLLALMAWLCWVIRFINYLAYYEADPEEEHHYQGDMRRTVNSSESRQNVGGMVNYQCR